MILAEDQVQAVKEIRTWWTSSKAYHVLNGSAGVGKSFTVESVVTQLPRAVPVLIAPTHKALRQLKEKTKGNYVFRTAASSLGIRPIDEGKGLKFEHTNLPSLWENVNLAVVDECFHPNIEVLTEIGFIKIVDLPKNILVANMDMKTKLTTFEMPINYIEKDSDSGLDSVLTDKLCSFITTKEHDHVVLSKGILTKRKLKDIKSFEEMYMTASSGIVGKTSLSDWDRLSIAFQADGSYNNWSDNKTKKCGTITNIRFSFVKERKILRLESLLTRLGLSYLKRLEVTYKTTFEIKNVPIEFISKELRAVFNLKDFSLSYARDFVDELVRWDGSILKDRSSLYYSSVIESNVSFAQAVAVLGGFKTNKTVQIGRRSTNFSDVHRLFINNNTTTNGYKLKRQAIPIEYTGKVYCLTMPRGTLIIRYNGQVCVSGNCGMLDTNYLELFKTTNVKILYVGHKSQLPPVKRNRAMFDTCISPVFEQGYPESNLWIPKRNTGDLWDFNNLLEKRIYSTKTAIPLTYDVTRAKFNTLLPEQLTNFASSNTKAALWTNEGVGRYNNKVRELLYPSYTKDNLPKYLPDDLVITTNSSVLIDGLEYLNDTGIIKSAMSADDIYTDTDGRVVSCKTVVVSLCPALHVECYKLHIVSSIEGDINLYELVHHSDYKRIADYYERKAWVFTSKESKSKAYRERALILKSFVVLKHFYASTVHRLQGSSVTNVLVIASDINRNSNVIERAKMMYVACSRCVDNLWIYKGI